MHDDGKTREQLFADLEAARQQVAELEAQPSGRERDEGVLRHSGDDHRHLFVTMAQGVVYQNVEGHITSANPAAESILGLSFDQMQGRTSVDPRWKCTREDGTEFPGSDHPSMTALRTGRPVRNVVMGVFNPKVEQHHWISIDAVPLFRPGEDKPHRVFTTFDDITERKRAEEALRTQTHDLGERVKELRCLYGISALVEKGSTFAEILQGVADLIPPSWQYPEITCARVVLDGQEHKSDNFKESCWTQTSDIHVHGEVVGSVEVFYLEEKPEDAEGPFLKEERALLNAIAERVGRLTEHKRAEDQIRRALHEKDVLLREIHHRVKNNLQIVISLLRLQSRQVVDEEALRAFANSEERIMAMALLHEMLYSSDNLGQVSCQDYVGKLVDGLSRVQGRAGGAILTADVAETSIDLDHAVPMGLILTELVSNALKHAFPGNRQGEVRISVQPVEGDQLEIVVSDDGVGVPVDFDLQETRSLGLRLVEMLAKQLGGTLRVSREDGTTFTVRFKHAPADGRA